MHDPERRLKAHITRISGVGPERNSSRGSTLHSSAGCGERTPSIDRGEGDSGDTDSGVVGAVQGSCSGSALGSLGGRERVALWREHRGTFTVDPEPEPSSSWSRDDFDGAVSRQATTQHRTLSGAQYAVFVPQSPIKSG